MFDINSQPKNGVTLESFSTWFKFIYKKQYPQDIILLQKNFADEQKINWLMFVCYCIVESRNLNSAEVLNKNLCGVMTQEFGDRGAELQIFKTWKQGFVAGLKKMRKDLSEKHVKLYELFNVENLPQQDETKKDTITVPSDPQSGWNDKTQPDGTELDIVTLKSELAKASKWIAIGSLCLGAVSVFVPQLRPISTALKAINEAIKLIKNSKKEN